MTDADVYYYTPEQIVETALRHGIRILSWTYNDPVVWHEFILDTARLAKEAGLINLYKSAFFITEEAVDELLPVIDIFSISIKSIDPVYYRKVTTGWVEPVLAATKKVYEAGKHVEVSTLMVTDISDDEQTARRISEWVKTELDANVPLHFVRFHPDYKMSNSTRTPIPKLLRAREVARELGIRHVYLGNVSGVDGTDSRCVKCGNPLVTRYGLNAKRIGLDAHGHCTQCGYDAHFKLPALPQPDMAEPDAVSLDSVELRTFDWHGDVVSLHVQAFNAGPTDASIHHRRRFADGTTGPWTKIRLASGESYRFIMAKSREDEVGPEVGIPPSVESNLHEVFDRAHFPTQSIEDVGVSHSDITPILRYAGKQNMYDQLRKQGESV